MSDYVKYDPELFVLKRLRYLDGGSSTFTELDMASFTLNRGYTENELGALILDFETASVSMSYWDDLPEDDPLRPGDDVHVFYNDELIFIGPVDHVDVSYSADPEAVARGHTRRVDFQASFGTDWFVTDPNALDDGEAACGAYARLRRTIYVDNCEADAPAAQLDQQPIRTADSATLSPIDAIRDFSAATLVPVRIFSLRQAHIVVNEPSLPTGFEASDADAMYTDTTWGVEPVPVLITLDSGDEGGGGTT